MNREGEEGIGFAIVVGSNPAKVNQILKLLGLPEKAYGHSQWIGKVTMHVDLNSFFPSCEEIRNPTLKGKPHAVIMTDETKDKITRGAVASCSYEARKYGVRSAMLPFYCQAIMSSTDSKSCRQILLSTSIRESYEFDRRVCRCIRASQYRRSISGLYKENNVADSAVSVEEYATTIKDAINSNARAFIIHWRSLYKVSCPRLLLTSEKPDGLTVIYPDQVHKFLENLEVIG